MLNAIQNYLRKHHLFRINHILLISVIALSMTACADVSNEMTEYDLAQMRYEQALRWQDYNTVLKFHKNAYNNPNRISRKRFLQFKVAEYKVISNIFTHDMRHATQRVQIRYFNTDYQVVHSMTLQNDWEYDPKANIWYLLNPMPTFK